MKRTFVLLLLMMAAVNALTWNYTSIESYVTVCRESYFNISSFIALPSPAATNENVYFYVTANNTGNCYSVDNVSFNLSLYNSVVVSCNKSSPSNGIYYAGDTPTFTFNCNTLAADTYTANITMTYSVLNLTGGVKFTGSENRSLTLVVNPASVGPTPGPGGGGAVPPSIPQPIFVQFKKYPVLQEVAPGSLIVVDLSVKNPTASTQNITVDLEGIPKNWINLFQSSALVGANQIKTLSFTVNVPENADSGDYLVKANIHDKGVSGYSYFIVRVKSYPENYLAPKIFRRVDLNFVDNTSTVKIIVQNDANSHRRVDVYEKIPKMLADNVDQVDFSTAPSSIVQADPLVMFTLNNMRPDEKRSIDYSIRNVIDEYEPYVYWPIEQVNILFEQGADKIQISNIYQSIVEPGSPDNYIAFDIGNVFTAPLNVTISLWLPSGWDSTPEKTILDIPSYSQTRVSMKVHVPKTTSDGVYYGGLLVTYENATTTKELVFRISAINKLVDLAAFIGFFMDNTFIVLVITAASVIIIVRTVRTRRRYEYIEDVSTTLNEIKDSVFRRR